LDTETPYFILRNSWGKDWGEDGFYKLAIGDLNPKSKGLC